MSATSANGLRSRSLLAVLTFTVFLLQAPASVSAHAFLVDTTPQAGERMGNAPEEIVLFFSEPIVAGSEELTVRDEAGEAVALLDLAPINDGLWVRGKLPPLDEGVYRASWQVMADDSHVSAGEFAFGVGEVGSVSTESSSRAGVVAWPETLASIMLLVGMVLAIGGLISERFVWRPLRRELGRELPRAPIVPSLLLALFGACLQVVLLVATRITPESSGFFDPLVWLEVLTSRPGLLSVATMVLLLYGFWLAMWSSRMPGLHLLVLLPLLGSVTATAYRGHAGGVSDWWVAPVNALHLLLAGVWIGALLHLVQVLWAVRRDGALPALARAAQRYAALALVLVPPLLLAGVVTALAVVDRPTELLTTAYGRLLSTKLLLVVAVLVLALVARARAVVPLVPNLLRRLTGFESIGLFLIVTLSAVLANSAPPQPRGQDLNELLGPAPLTGPVLRLADLPGQLALFLAAAEDQLQLRVVEPSSEGAQGAALEITGQRPDGVTFDLYPRRCGPGCFSMDVAWPEGITRISVAASHELWTGGEVEFEVPWPIGEEASERLEAVIEEMGSIPSFTMTEEVSSGPDATFSSGSFRMPNPFFISEEVYANGGATDVRLLPNREPGISELVLFLPGSLMWYKLWIDDENRLTRALIVNPGHRIARTFTYDD